MKHKHLPVLFFIGVIMAVLYGCGGGGGGGSDVTISPASSSNPAVPVTLVNPESQACVPCHAAAPAGGTTAQSPAALYSLSLHNTENQATCASCHNTTPGHSALGTDSKAPLASTNIPNPDLATVNASGTVVAGSQCLNCHTAAKLGLPHFNNDVSNNYTQFKGTQSAQFVDYIMTSGRANVKKCTACHTSHDASISTMPIFKAYAEAGHGNVKGEAWVHYRWKDTNLPPKASYSSDRSACQRCHTTTGFVSQITLGTEIPTGTTSLGTGKVQFDTSGNATKDNTKQVLRCDACHQYSNFKYNVRDASPSLTAAYKDASATYIFKDVSGNTAREATIVDASGTIKFPDVAKSNLCINCHSGRESGGSIKLSTGNFTNLSFINSHYLAAGGVLYRTGGYRYDDVSTTITYDNSNGFAHKYIGLDSGVVSGRTRNYTATTGDGGPCVGCHMFPVRHTFKPVAKDETTGKVTSVTSGICTACHSNGISVEVLEGGTTTETQGKANFDAAMAALKAQLALKGYYFYNGHPYFYTSAYDPTYTEQGSCTKNLPVKNWQTSGTSKFTWSGTSCTSAADTAGTAGTGTPNMGAAFNYNLLAHEPGAYLHNRSYAKRLIWDSIDWLDDNTMNNSTAATIDALAAAFKITADEQTKAKLWFTSSGTVKRP